MNRINGLLARSGPVWDSRALDTLPIGCNVKGESGAFSDDFSACLIAGGQTTPQEVVLVDIDGD